jgi:hypothetical protein
MSEIEGGHKRRSVDRQRSAELGARRRLPAVFQKSLPDRWAELDRLAKPRVDFLDEMDAIFDAKPYPADAYCARSPLMLEIRLDGLEL